MGLDPGHGENQVALQGPPGHHEAHAAPFRSFRQGQAHGHWPVQGAHLELQRAQGRFQADLAGHGIGVAETRRIGHLHPGLPLQQPGAGSGRHFGSGAGQGPGSEQIGLDQHAQAHAHARPGDLQGLEHGLPETRRGIVRTGQQSHGQTALHRDAGHGKRDVGHAATMPSGARFVKTIVQSHSSGRPPAAGGALFKPPLLA